MLTIPRSPIRVALGAALLLLPAAAPAQTFHGRDEVQRRPFHGTGVTTSTDVEARLDGSILQVHVSQTFENHGGRVEEIEPALSADSLLAPELAAASLRAGGWLKSIAALSSLRSSRSSIATSLIV